MAVCVHEILSDVLLFHKNNENILPQWEVRSTVISPRPFFFPFGNPYVSRVATRVGSRTHAELISMLQLMLPGVNNVYYGDELGMRDLANDTKIAPQRGAMQWSDGVAAGFSDRENPPIPVHPDFKNINWEVGTAADWARTLFKNQYQQSSSPLKMFSKLAKLRQTDETVKHGKTFVSGGRR